MALFQSLLKCSLIYLAPFTLPFAVQPFCEEIINLMFSFAGKFLMKTVKFKTNLQVSLMSFIRRLAGDLSS